MKKPISKTSSFRKSTTDTVYALIYRRVSSDRQESEGNGLDSQELRCKQYCEAMGYIVDQVFSDTKSGGGDYSKREGITDLIKHIDKYPHRTFVVVVDDLSRIARDTRAYLALKEALRSRKVEFASPNFNFDDSPEGEYIETITAAGNELHRKVNRRQVIQKQKARLDAGYWPFGGKKGYVIIKDPIHKKIATPHPTEAQLLKEALEGFSTGIFVRRIDACKFLRENGFWQNQRPEKYIDKFSEFVRDPFYAGFIAYPKWEVSRRIGKHQGIISLETFERNQKRLAKDQFNRRVRMDITPDFPMRGLITCDGCNEHLTAGWSKYHRYPYYVCHNRSCKLYGKSIRRDDVDKEFKKLLLRNRLKPEVEKILIPVFDRVWEEEVGTFKKRGAALVHEKETLEEKTRQLTEMVIAAKSASVKKVYEKQLEEAAEKIEAIEGQSVDGIDLSVPYRTALDKAAGLLKHPYFIWQKLETGEQQKLFYFIFEQKLPYDIKEGYRTDKIPCATTLFEEFAIQNPLDVEMGGVEPPSEREDRNASTRVVELEGSSRDIEDRRKYPMTILEGSADDSGDRLPILRR